MNISTYRPINSQPDSITELTRAVQRVLQEFSVQPLELSIFLDGTEIYRYQTTDDHVFWWGSETISPLAGTSVASLSSH